MADNTNTSSPVTSGSSTSADEAKSLRLGDFRQDSYEYDGNTKFVQGEATEVPKTKVKKVLEAAERDGIVLVEAEEE